MLASLLLTLRAAGEGLPPGALDTLTKSVLGALVAILAAALAWLIRELVKTNREQRAALDALNAEFRHEIAPLLTRAAEAINMAYSSRPRGR